MPCLLLNRLRLNSEWFSYVSCSAGILKDECLLSGKISTPSDRRLTRARAGCRPVKRFGCRCNVRLRQCSTSICCGFFVYNRLCNKSTTSWSNGIWALTHTDTLLLLLLLLACYYYLLLLLLLLLGPLLYYFGSLGFLFNQHIFPQLFHDVPSQQGRTLGIVASASVGCVSSHAADSVKALND